MRTNLATVPSVVAISLTIPATNEDTASLPRPGQRRWWLQGPKPDGDRDPWWTIGSLPSNRPCTLDVELVPGGKYILGTGIGTRVRFVCPLVPCTLGVDPSSGTARPVVPSRHPAGTATNDATDVKVKAQQNPKDRHVGGVRITSADNGTGSIRVTTLVWRLLCSNGMMGFGPGTTERIIHRGSRESMVTRLADAFELTN